VVEEGCRSPSKSLYPRAWGRFLAGQDRGRGLNHGQQSRYGRIGKRISESSSSRLRLRIERCGQKKTRLPTSAHVPERQNQRQQPALTRDMQVIEDDKNRGQQHLDDSHKEEIRKAPWPGIAPRREREPCAARPEPGWRISRAQGLIQRGSPRRTWWAHAKHAAGDLL